MSDHLPPNRRTRESLTELTPAPGSPSPLPVRPSRPAKSAASWVTRVKLVAGIVIVTASSVLVAYGLRRYLHQSPRFAIKTVYIDGNVRRSAHQIAKRAGIEIGKNIFLIDEQNATQGVENDAWVETARVRRELPSTVHVEVVEREAHVLVVVDEELYLVDGRGEIFKPWREGDPTDLPVVTGLRVEEVARDREAVRLRLRRVLDLKADLERKRIDRRYPLQEVNLNEDGSIIVLVGSDAVALELGRGPYRKKIAKARVVLSELRRRKVTPSRIFLDNETHPERVVARMR